MAVLTFSYGIAGTSPDNFTLKGDEGSSTYRGKKHADSEVHKP